MTETPKQLGFYMPAEWQEHSAVWLAWPYDKISFPGRIPKVEKDLVKIISAIHTTEAVELLVLDEKIKNKAIKMFTKAGVDVNKITFHITDYADIWLRDYGPMFISNPETHEQAWIKWAYNAYGNKFPELLKDNEVFFNLRGAVDKRMFEPGIIMEGGAIDVNGLGTLITTEQCLLNPNRNPKLNKEQTEKYLRDYLGINKVIWLKKGLVNDHTDGHLDEIARFVSETKIVCAIEDDAKSPNYQILLDNFEALQKATDAQGKPFEIIKLPLPHLLYDNDKPFEAGEMATASYTNFYIGNEMVLASVFNDPNDEKALEILQSVFPDRKIIPIDCTDLVYGAGALHCMTQQQPAV